jgi:hypothetical protein
MNSASPNTPPFINDQGHLVLQVQEVAPGVKLETYIELDDLLNCEDLLEDPPKAGK